MYIRVSMGGMRGLNLATRMEKVAALCMWGAMRVNIEFIPGIPSILRINNTHAYFLPTHHHIPITLHVRYIFFSVLILLAVSLHRTHESHQNREKVKEKKKNRRENWRATQNKNVATWLPHHTLCRSCALLFIPLTASGAGDIANIRAKKHRISISFSRCLGKRNNGKKHRIGESG